MSETRSAALTEAIAAVADELELPGDLPIAVLEHVKRDPVEALRAVVRATKVSITQRLEAMRAVGAASAVRPREADARAVQQVGWLIEAGSAPPKYWDGRGVDRLAFTEDANEALRFSRREDAEVVRCWLLEKAPADFLRAAEHLWMKGEPR